MKQTVTRFNLANPDMNKEFLAIYGGEESFKAHMPLFYEAYLKTKAAHDKGIDLDYPTFHTVAESERNTFVDGLDVDWIWYDRETGILTVSVSAALTKKASRIEQDVLVVVDSVIIYSGNSSDVNTNQVYQEIKIPVRSKLSADPREVNVNYMVVWQDADLGLLRGEKMTSLREIVPIDVIDHYDVRFPISAKNEDVHIGYGREPKDFAHIDRNYPVVNVDDGIKAFLDVDATVEFSKGDERFEGIDPTTFDLRLKGPGMIQYQTTGRMDDIRKRFTAMTDGFTFTLDNDWMDMIPRSMLNLNTALDILMRVEFDLESGSKGELIMSSQVEKSQAGVCKLQKIRIYMGCLAANSQIYMADGSRKSIQDIKIGDAVKTADGTDVVRNTWHGIEERPLVCLETELGKLICTDTHPVKSGRGWLRVCDINAADVLIGADGRKLEITGLYPVECAEVYNLDVDGNCFISDGILVGDMGMQNDLKYENEKEQALFEESIAGIRAESEAANKYFRTGKWS